ncbi:hypothetical protein IC619_008530 [Hazenella sp. IB182353]|uniref:hypothetical protein n=1 Tax=Polycladospora coralii TaxID=2771432 RepID=UPI0017463ABF|nr:hypothetical protein [Polycladospora coralii]MBS7530535.1 hypothetical protein [Polycladospora coralii]
MKKFFSMMMIFALVFTVSPSVTAFAEGNTPGDQGAGSTAEETKDQGTGNTTEEKKDQGTGNTSEEKKDQGTENTTEETKDQGTGNTTEETKDQGTGSTTEEKKETENTTEEDLTNEELLEECISDNEVAKIDVDTKQLDNGDIELTAKTDGKNVNGIWLIFGHEVDPNLDFSEFEKNTDIDSIEGITEVVYEEIESNGNALTYVLSEDKVKLKNGKAYEFYVYFVGQIDDKDCVLREGYTDFLVEDEEYVPGDDTNPNPTEKVDSETAKGSVETVKQLKGGKLPTTANTYPTAMLIGFVIVLVGLLTLRVSRN